jgi:hypothetical protein
LQKSSNYFKIIVVRRSDFGKKINSHIGKSKELSAAKASPFTITPPLSKSRRNSELLIFSGMFPLSLIGSQLFGISDRKLKIESGLVSFSFFSGKNSAPRRLFALKLPID